MLLLALALPAEARVQRYLTGNAQDMNPGLFGPVLNLGGGGTDVDGALQWMINKARGCGDCTTQIDVVVIRSSGDDGYNRPIALMQGVDSVETLVITSRRSAQDAAVAQTIRNAEVIFFAGGDQCTYVEYYRDTPVDRAVEAVYAKGGAVGGTSAGTAIQGHWIYDGCTGSVVSNEALRNPYNRLISFSDKFFDWNFLEGTITDTHFVPRDRMGRLMAFVARQLQDTGAPVALGIGVNEGTSVIVDTQGVAQVVGAGPAYFVLADHAPEVCTPGTPLTYRNFKIWKITSGGTFDLNNRPTTGYLLSSVVNGQIQGNPY